MKSSSCLWYVPIATLALASCAGPKLIDTGAVAIASPGTLPPPSMVDVTDGARPHFVGPFDEISVDVLGLPELSRLLRVDAAGDVSVPAAGTVNVIGKSPEELAVVIEERMRSSYVKDPHVTVTVTETVSQTVTVDGEVKAPGIYPVLGRMTLMKAVASAQGTNEIADARRVVIFRRVDGKQMAALYDLRAIRLGAYQDPQIYTNDVVVVGESNSRRLFPQVLQAAGLLMAPLIAVLDNN